MEVERRIHGWASGTIEHAVIVDDPAEGISIEGIVLGGSTDHPIALRYAIAAPAGAASCRGLSVRVLGSPIIFEIFSDGDGTWTDDQGRVLHDLDGAIHVDLGISPMGLALTIKCDGPDLGSQKTFRVAAIDIEAGEINLATCRITRDGEYSFRVEYAESPTLRALRVQPYTWEVEPLK